MIKNKIISLFYKLVLELHLKPRAKRQILKASKSDDYRALYGKEIEYIKTKGLSFIPYIFDEVKDSDISVFWDKSKNLPYVNLFSNLKLYFKSITSEKEIRKSISSLLNEQNCISPHLYISKNDTFFYDNHPILIDAGCAEGNFSLEYGEYCKSIYLIEGDVSWERAVEATFDIYKDKTVFINKFVGYKTLKEKNIISLDDLFPDLKNESVFLKMDLEGFGLDALKGAKKLLKNNNCYVSCATYHYQREFDDIKKFFEDQFPNYTLDSSEGYCYFWFDINQEYPYFRKGILRAKKEI